MNELSLKKIDYFSFSDIINYIFEYCHFPEKKYFDNSDIYQTPYLTFLIVADGSVSDMFSVVFSDSSAIVQFCKQVSSDSVVFRCGYSIPKRMLKMVNLKRQKVVSNIRELIFTEPKYFKSILKFYNKEKEEITFDQMIEDEDSIIKYGTKKLRTIHDVVTEIEELRPLFAYYISQESYNNIHCFAKIKNQVGNSTLALNLLNNKNKDDNGDLDLEYLNTQLAPHFDPLIESTKFKQNLNLQIAGFVVNYMFEYMFDKN